MPTRNDLANAIRMLTVDAIEKSKSGHPGAPMGMANIAEVLWRDHLKHNPQNPNWFNRDRFVLSNGHGSMLLYSLLHLTGYDLSLEELKNFRQMHSKTPGHPEYGYAPGVETTTGPLGQGFANSVGFALAEKILASRFNKSDSKIIDHNTYVFLGDGCLMEGISHEAASLAGTWKLGKLIAFYDDNGISIDGHVKDWFSDDTKSRFEAYGWQVITVADGHDPKQINEAIVKAKAESSKPTMIICKTIIGYGSPNKSGSHDCHGAPLGAEETEAARKFLKWPYGPFEIPQEIYQEWDGKEAGAAYESEWNTLWTSYSKKNPKEAGELKQLMSGELPEDFEDIAKGLMDQTLEASETVATRKASLYALNYLGPKMTQLLGGSADLAPSNLTKWKGAQSFSPENPEGNYLHYGVREFGMAAIMNGISLHGGFIPYGGTFLMFMEYARNAVRMASIMKLRQLYVFTHDSIGLGEDGPTHQPVEQVASLRTTPNLDTWRPCDTVETSAAWIEGLRKSDGPTALILSRQNLPFQERTEAQVADIQKGGYILSGSPSTPDLILIATGSEVALAMDSAEALRKKGISVRVVSMPCTEAFDRQPEEYRNKVLPPTVKARVAIEALSPDSWYKYTGLDGAVIGMSTFGESAPAGELFKHFGFSVDNVVKTSEDVLEKNMVSV